MKMTAALLLGLVGAAAAQGPGGQGGAGGAGGQAGQVDSTATRPAAPGLGGVKSVVKDAVKGALPGALGGGAAPRPAAAVVNPAATLQQRLTMLRRKTLRDEDFLENDERNRDPFRSYVRLFTPKEGPQTPKVPAIFDKFALEELTLIAIVTGDSNPRAMFRDPGGMGESVKRGDYVSKNGARVSKILSDRIVLELNEVTATGESRSLEKAIMVNPEQAQR